MDALRYATYRIYSICRQQSSGANEQCEFVARPRGARDGNGIRGDMKPRTKPRTSGQADGALFVNNNKYPKGDGGVLF